MNAIFRTALGMVGAAIAMQAAAQATFYEREGFHGRSFTTQRQIGDFGRYGFNDRASSVEVVGNARNGGKSAKTSASAGGAWSCVPGDIRRWQRWA